MFPILHFTEALQVLRAMRPLARHDQACPNRSGILRGLEGRLLLLAGQRAEAARTLAEARRESEELLALVEAAEKRGSPG